MRCGDVQFGVSDFSLCAAVRELTADAFKETARRGDSRNKRQEVGNGCMVNGEGVPLVWFSAINYGISTLFRESSFNFLTTVNKI
jgi:hypothetical protein